MIWFPWNFYQTFHLLPLRSVWQDIYKTTFFNIIGNCALPQKFKMKVLTPADWHEWFFCNFTFYALKLQRGRCSFVLHSSPGVLGYLFFSEAQPAHYFGDEVTALPDEDIALSRAELLLASYTGVLKTPHTWDSYKKNTCSPFSVQFAHGQSPSSE